MFSVAESQGHIGVIPMRKNEGDNWYSTCLCLLSVKASLWSKEKAAVLFYFLQPQLSALVCGMNRLPFLHAHRAKLSGIASGLHLFVAPSLSASLCFSSLLQISLNRTTSQLYTTLQTKAFKMMQITSDSASNKHSLINVMHRFIAATNNMDETIMVPSLLRDMPLEEQASSEVETNNNIEPMCHNKQKDMYEHYLLLKSIKNDMEWGLLKREMNSSSSFLDIPLKQKEEKQGSGDAHPDDNADLENQFHYHLRGLFGVLSKLTLQADHLTNRYKREIGGGNFMR